MAASALQPAFVLHRRRYGDTSLLLELLTRDHGRLAAVAKGAIDARRGKSGLLQPFIPLLVGYHGRGEVGSLGGVEAAGRPFVLRGPQLYCGIYLNELLVQLTGRSDGHPQLFADYTAAVACLATGDPPDTALRQFELRLLDALGFGLALTTEADGQTPVEVQRRYHYRVDAGPVPATQDGIYSGAMLLHLAAGAVLTPAERNEARHLLRTVLDYHLGGRPLRSRELFHAGR